MEIILILGCLFILIFVGYVAVSFFLPEMVGITGQKAKEVMEQQEQSPSPDDPRPPAP